MVYSFSIQHTYAGKKFIFFMRFKLFFFLTHGYRHLFTYGSHCVKAAGWGLYLGHFKLDGFIWQFTKVSSKVSNAFLSQFGDRFP